VRGILVTEGVRGEGGVLRNKEGRRFMFDDIPANYRSQTADNEEEGWRYCQGDKSARRPPELLTRDHVARCILREVREGRGSPHGGVFLDIAWIRERMPRSAEHIRKKLPGMYHQFKQLADIDITAEPMEVGPTTHYMMGGIRVNADTQMSTLSGLFAAGECAAGLHGANRLGGNSLSDLLVFGKRAGEHAALWSKERAAPAANEAQIEAAAREALEPFEREPSAEVAPYQIQSDLENCMQDKVGIVRREEEMKRALETLAALRARVDRAAVGGSREYNPGWHTALDLRSMLTVSLAVTHAALRRKESRGAHFRDDFPAQDAAAGRVNIVVRRGRDGTMQIEEVPLREISPELKQVIEEMK
jgi:succinate dehydrogenase / fumarate reductase flavoprotein subunit